MPPSAKRTPAAKTPAAKKKRAVPQKSGGINVPVEWKLAIAGMIMVALLPLYYGYLIKTVASTWRWLKDAGHNPHYHTYSSFNIPIPDQYSIHGIDVSSYQGKIDWQLVKSMKQDSIHISFAFIKATEGVFLIDPYFQRNWREAPKAGIVCGAYHYFRPNSGGKWQAKFFLQTVRTEKSDLPMAVDVEELDGTKPEQMRHELQVFLDVVEAKTGTRPIIYSGLSFYRDYLLGYFDSYPLWIAHYYHPELEVSKSTPWRFWQHSDKARVNGINHVVDFNVFNGDSLAFRKILIH